MVPYNGPMPLVIVFSFLIFLGCTLWSFISPLIFLVTGLKWSLTGGGKVVDYSSSWVQVTLLIFLICGGTLLFGHRRLRSALENEVRLGAGISALFLFLGYLLLRFQSEVLMAQRQAVSFQNSQWLFLATGVFFLILAFKPPKRGEWALGGAILFLLTLSPFIVWSFPFEMGFSDVFLDVEEACRNLLHGISPYGLQKGREWEGGCSYFPGLWLSFLPAVVLKTDPRYLAAMYQVLFALVVWKAMGEEHRLLTTWLLVLFLLNPWSLLRHDVYVPVYLLVWSLFYGALRKGKTDLSARWYGLGLSMHPFHWALIPVWFFWMVKGFGFEKALGLLLQALAVAALIVLPFVLWDPRGFFQGVILHFAAKGAVNQSHFGLVVWLANNPLMLTSLALMFLGMGALAVWRGRGTLDSLFQWLACSLGLALLSSYHIEHYYYLAPLVLVLFHQITVLDPKISEGHRSEPSWSWENRQVKGEEAPNS